jgi:hypothetical protein
LEVDRSPVFGEKILIEQRLELFTEEERRKMEDFVQRKLEQNKTRPLDDSEK